MTRRRVLLLGSATVVALLGFAVAVWILWPRQSVITRENAAKVKFGMTRAEVEAIFDGPARDDSTGPLDHVVGGGGGVVQRRWISDEVIAVVGFDADERVEYQLAAPVQPLPQESLIDRFRGWLGL